MSHDEPPIYAGFVTRTAGYIVDDVLILVIGTAGAIGAGLVLDAVIPGGVTVDVAAVVGSAAWGLVLSACYFVGFWSLAGQTPGMRLMGVVVVPSSGGRLSLWRGFVRAVGLAVCWLTLGLGFLLVLVDDRRQGLHDKLASTLVLYSRGD